MFKEIKDVVIVTNWLRRGGGAEENTIKIANFLLKLGFSVRVLVFESSENLLATSLLPEIKIIYLEKNYSTTGSFCLLLRFIKQNPNSLYFAANHRIAILLIIQKWLTRKNFKIFARNISNLSILMKNKPFFNFILKSFFKKIDRIIAQSEAMKQDLILNYGFRETQVEVIYNPIEMIFPFIDNYSLPAEPWKLIFIGRLRPEKGLEFLISAMDILNKRGKNFQLRILGEGPLNNRFQEEVIAKKMGDKIFFEGFREDFSSYLAGSDLLLLTSIYEGFPNVLLHAHAHGIPVVSFDTPFGPKEIIIEGVNGYLANYLDLDDLVEKIELAMNTKWAKSQIVKTTDRFNRLRFETQIESFFKSES